MAEDTTVTPPLVEPTPPTTTTLVQVSGRVEQALVEKVTVIGGLMMVLIAYIVIAKLAWEGNETALGALIGTATAGTAYYLRGRVEKQS